MLSSLVLLVGVGTLHAGKPTDDFKAAFEEVWKGRHFRVGREAGPVVTWALLQQDGLVGSSPYGRSRKGSDNVADCYRLEIRDGRAHDPEPERQRKRKIWADIKRGAVLEFFHVYFKDNRVDFWLYTSDSVLVPRNDEYGKKLDLRESFCTELRFVLPFPTSHQPALNDVPAALEYVGQWLSPAKSEADARRLHLRTAIPWSGPTTSATPVDLR